MWKKLWLNIKKIFSKIKLWMVLAIAGLVSIFIFFNKFFLSEDEYKEKVDQHLDKAENQINNTNEKVKDIDSKIDEIKKEQSKIKNNIEDRKEKEKKFFDYL